MPRQTASGSSLPSREHPDADVPYKTYVPKIMLWAAEQLMRCELLKVLAVEQPMHCDLLEWGTKQLMHCYPLRVSWPAGQPKYCSAKTEQHVHCIPQRFIQSTFIFLNKME